MCHQRLLFIRWMETVRVRRLRQSFCMCVCWKTVRRPFALLSLAHTLTQFSRAFFAMTPIEMCARPFHYIVDYINAYYSINYCFINFPGSHWMEFYYYYYYCVIKFVCIWYMSLLLFAVKCSLIWYNKILCNVQNRSMRLLCVCVCGLCTDRHHIWM